MPTAWSSHRTRWSRACISGQWIPWRDLGYKAAAVNWAISPRSAPTQALLTGLALPPETASEAIVELYEGLAEPGTWPEETPPRADTLTPR